jgi:hypothetical protein
VARDKDIIIKSFSAGQTNTRAEKGFRMSKLLKEIEDNIPVPIAIPPSSIEYGYVSPRLPELTDSMCNNGGK